MLGEVRTYVRCGQRHDFEAWSEAVKKGRTFVTSGGDTALKFWDLATGHLLASVPTSDRMVRPIAWTRIT